MLAGQARAAALHWVRHHAGPGFRGAFLTGSAADRSLDEVQPAWSDVDVTVLLAGPVAPPKPGKIRHRGALLDVTYLPVSALADPEKVAATHYLAPSFAGPDAILSDPTGLLGGLRAHIAPTFRSPAAVRKRVADVLAAVRTRLAARDEAAPWPQQVLAWLFPASLVAVAVLVAAGERPTVRTRYRRARAVLGEESGLYARMLGLLGCADVDAEVVVGHLDRLAVVFDEAAAVGPTRFPFASDISAQARPVAIDGSRALVAAGDHREAVFWIVATFARCERILGDRPDAPDFSAALAELVGVRGPGDLRARTAATLAFLPELEEATAAIGGF
ncbi:MAG TPA: hypothetical protein VKZ81_21280 [Pseudonocardia sp.]|uniref:hypothetical protein n=1 Tax=Pseudonocardia sp. TaxID=60912 RepID=UPI002B4B2327|nr:hypothetical protein [Pseudonocardia sp.]HLU58001.1 hypothetical protein [Pseudonocardia sp.]